MVLISFCSFPVGDCQKLVYSQRYSSTTGTPIRFLLWPLSSKRAVNYKYPVHRVTIKIERFENLIFFKYRFLHFWGQNIKMKYMSWNSQRFIEFYVISFILFKHLGNGWNLDLIKVWFAKRPIFIVILYIVAAASVS